MRCRAWWLRFYHDDVIKWKHFPRYWPFAREIHRSPVNSPHKGQWRGALMFSLIWVWMNDWVNNREAGDLRRDRAHFDVTVMHHITFIGIELLILCQTSVAVYLNHRQSLGTKLLYMHVDVTPTTKGGGYVVFNQKSSMWHLRHRNDEWCWLSKRFYNR